MTERNFQALIGIVVAAREEFEPLRPAIELLDRLGCPYEALVASPYVAPKRLLDWAARAQSEGICALIATAGEAPQLPGLLAAVSQLPVIAVPLAMADTRSTFDVLQFALATGPTASLVAVQPGGAQQAASHVLRILGLLDSHWRRVLDQYQSQIENEETEINRELREGWLNDEENTEEQVHEGKRHPQEHESDEDETFSPRLAPKPSSIPTTSLVDDERDKNVSSSLSSGDTRTELDPNAPPALRVPRQLGILRIDPDTPEVELIEEAIDCLLEGGVIALPTDTVYGLACDATNATAVALLSEIKGRPPDKAVSLLVDSQKQLGLIASNLSAEIRRLTEAFWPGPLTILFRKRPGNFAHISTGESIAVRLPDHSTPLAIMQGLNRPLAFTSAALQGLPEPMSADIVEEMHGDRLHLILDGGTLPENKPSTVIDVTGEPFKILRQGGVSAAQLNAIVGEKLETS